MLLKKSLNFLEEIETVVELRIPNSTIESPKDYSTQCMQGKRANLESMVSIHCITSLGTCHNNEGILLHIVHGVKKLVLQTPLKSSIFLKLDIGF